MALIPGIRKKLKIERLVAHMIVALGLVFLPIALEEILLGITQSFKTWSYPMLVNTHAFHSFASGMESSGTMMQPTAFGVSAISMDTLNHPELLGFVSTGSVNLWITLILALLVIWIVLLNHIVSKAISNIYIALLVRIGIVGGLIGLACSLPNTWINLLNPIAYANVVDILSGNLHYSLLTGILVCASWILIEIIVSVVRKNRKVAC